MADKTKAQEQQRNSYLKHREKRLAAAREYRRKYPKKIKESKQREYLKNREHYREYAKKYYRENTQRAREYWEEYRKRFPEKVRASQRRWYLANTDCKRRDGRSKNPEYGRLKHIQRRYNLSPTEVFQLRESQNFECKICRIHEDDAPKGRLYVDHNHKTLRVRALLCSQCNAMLGMARESAKILRQGADYLDKIIG